MSSILLWLWTWKSFSSESSTLLCSVSQQQKVKTSFQFDYRFLQILVFSSLLVHEKKSPFFRFFFSFFFLKNLIIFFLVFIYIFRGIWLRLLRFLLLPFLSVEKKPFWEIMGNLRFFLLGVSCFSCLFSSIGIFYRILGGIYLASTFSTPGSGA